MSTIQVSPRSTTCYDPTEPRRPSEAAPYSFPQASSKIKAADALSMLALGSSGMCMLTRFPIWAWLGVLLSIASMRSQKSLHQDKQGASFSGLSCLLFALTAMTSVYLPVLQGVAVKAPMSNPFKLNSGVIPLKL